MTRPPTRLFHLHYNTPDVSGLETALADVGLPLHRRFGWVEDEFVTLSPSDPIPEPWRFYVETLQRGYANLTLGSAPQFRFDHIGIYSADFDAIVERAEAAGWRVHDQDGRRPFLMTPWRFRIELHPDGDDVEHELGFWATAHFEEVVLVVPDAKSVRRSVSQIVGPVPGLVITDGDVERPAVPQFTLGGKRFPDQPVVDVHALAGDRAVSLEGSNEP